MKTKTGSEMKIYKIIGKAEYKNDDNIEQVFIDF